MLKEKKALEILRTYEGTNDHILRMKAKAMKNERFFPTKSQCDYILEFQDVKPLIGKKWVNLDYYYAKKIADKKLYLEVPEKIYVYKVLGEREDSFHIWGRFFENEPFDSFWFPKGSLVDKDKKKVNVDFLKYTSKPLMEHQKVGVIELLKNDTFILGDDMGLGKTYTSIVSALESGARKILVVCPASLKYNWKSEISAVCDRGVSVVNGKEWKEDDFVIVNYEILKNFHSGKGESKILETGFDLMIVDEAHYLCNPKSDRSKLVGDFSKDIKKIWLLTGTPVTSKPANLINLLKIIRCPLINNWSAFVIRYCNGYQFTVRSKDPASKGRKIWKMDGASNLDELRIRLKDYFLRRLKTKELQLPDKMIIPRVLKMDSPEYIKLMGEYKEWRKSHEHPVMSLSLAKIMPLRMLMAKEKVPATIEIAENAIESGKKAIIFTSFTETLEDLLEHFGDIAVRLDGKMTDKQKEIAKRSFQEDDKVKILVGNLKAAGVGHTLTAAEVVIMNDLSFLPSDLSQAEDRAYRIGQENNVLVYYPLFVNTAEMVIYDILRRKMKIISTITGDSEIMEENDNTLKEIMKAINGSDD